MAINYYSAQDPLDINHIDPEVLRQIMDQANINIQASVTHGLAQQVQGQGTQGTIAQPPTLAVDWSKLSTSGGNGGFTAKTTYSPASPWEIYLSPTPQPDKTTVQVLKLYNELKAIAEGKRQRTSASLNKVFKELRAQATRVPV